MVLEGPDAWRRRCDFGLDLDRDDNAAVNIPGKAPTGETILATVPEAALYASAPKCAKFIGPK